MDRVEAECRMAEPPAARRARRRPPRRGPALERCQRRPPRRRARPTWPRPAAAATRARRRRSPARRASTPLCCHRATRARAGSPRPRPRRPRRRQRRAPAPARVPRAARRAARPRPRVRPRSRRAGHGEGPPSRAEASLPAAMTVADAPPMDLPATACAWCGSDAARGRPPWRRARPVRALRAAATVAVAVEPTLARLRGLYRPDPAASPAPATPPQRARGPSRSAARRHRAARPGARRGRRRRHADDALSGTGREAWASSVAARRPTWFRRHRGHRGRLGRDRLLALARAPAAAAAALEARRAEARARRRARDRRAEPRQPPGAAFGDRWLALDLPRHLVHLPAGRLVARLETLGLRGRAGEPPARRPGRLRLAARPRRPAARPTRPLRRDPQARGAQPRRSPRRRRAARSSPARSCSRWPPSPALAEAALGAAAASTWRRGAA